MVFDPKKKLVQDVPPVATQPVVATQQKLGTNQAGQVTASGYVMKAASPTPAIPSPAVTPAVSPVSTPILKSGTSGSTLTSTSYQQPIGSPLTGAAPVSNLEKVATETIDQASKDKADAEASVGADYQIKYNMGEEWVKKGWAATNPFPKNQSDYFKNKQAIDQQAVDYTKKQNEITNQLDQASLARQNAQGQAAISGTTASMAQSREGVIGSSAPLVAKSFSAETNQLLTEAATRTSQAKSARDQAVLNLENAQKTGLQGDIEWYSAAVSKAETALAEAKSTQLKENAAATESSMKIITTLGAQGMLDNATPEMIQHYAQIYNLDPISLQEAAKSASTKNTTEQQKSQLDNIKTGLGLFKEAANSGVEMSKSMIESMSKQIGVDPWTLSQYSDEAKQIMSLKNIDAATQEGKLIELNNKLELEAKGIFSEEGKNIETIKQMYQRGDTESAHLLERKLGIDDLSYTSEIKLKTAQATIAELDAKYKYTTPPKGTKDYIDYKKAELDLEIAEQDNATYTGNVPANSLKEAFYLPGKSRISPSFAEGNKQCGEGSNDITDGKKVGNSYDSKMAVVTKKENPEVGNQLVLPLAVGGLVTDSAKQPGHIETVIIPVNPATGEFKTVSWNLDLKGGQTIETHNINTLSSKYGDDWGLSDSTLKPEFANKLSALNTITKSEKGGDEYNKFYKQGLDELDMKPSDAKKYAQTEASKIINEKKEINSKSILAGVDKDLRSSVMQKANQFDGEQQVKTFQTIQTMKSKADSVSNNTTNPQDDQMLVYTFAKAMDPSSSVREGEYASVQGYAQTALQSMGVNATRFYSNAPFLNEESRKNIKTSIDKAYESERTSYSQVRNQYIKSLNNIAGTEIGETLLQNYDTKAGYSNKPNAIESLMSLISNNFNKPSENSNVWDEIDTTSPDDILNDFN